MYSKRSITGEESMAFRNVAIIGMGLLGASLGMALKNGPYRRLCWTRRAEIRAWSLAHDAADETADRIEDILGRADLTVFALPIPAIIEFMERYAGAWRRDSVVTDMGSVKGVISDAAERFLIPRGVRFVGSHPMAGTEKSGCENAFPTLYENADVFVCPGSNASPENVTDVEDFWKSIRTRPVHVDVRGHDLLVAHTSHVLHVVASALALKILGAENDGEKALRFAGCATGFRDTSRIASSNPAMWREIIENNTPAVLEALENFSSGLDEFRKMIETGEYDRFERTFAEGKALRDSWLRYKGY